jgi:hypothetical protein
LAALGRITTASQMQNVEITWCSLCSEAIEFIMNSQEFKRMKPLNFESYWADPAVDVYSALLTPLKKYFQGLDITRKGVAVGNIKNDLVQVLQKLEFKRFTYPLGYKRIAKPPNGCPKDLATFATVVKFLSHDPVNFNGIRMYFQLDSWNVPQAPLTDLDKAIFKGLPYFRYFVLWPVSEVTLHCEKKYIIEKKILQICRDSKDCPGLVSDLECFPEFTHIGTKHNLGLQVITDQQLKMNRSVTFTKKLVYALHSTLLQDMIDTINHYGFNFHVRMTENANHLVHLYL